MRAALAGLATLVLFAASAAPALAHGDQAEVAAKTPARTLVQQALALMTQQNNSAEAKERLETALKSKKRENVRMPAVRDAIKAIEASDNEGALEHMRTALRAEEKPKQPEETEEEAGDEENGDADGHAEDEHAADEGLKESEVAVGHEAALDPGRGTEEWIALAVGIVLGLGALGLLARQRRAG